MGEDKAAKDAKEPKKAKEPAAEGLRSRKRRQRHERIIESAISLFLEHGYDAVTIDQIVARADISKRTFFDYFSNKEAVIVAWQDEFGVQLVEHVRARPETESMIEMAENAAIEAMALASTKHSVAVAKLISNTPALSARDHVKYAKLEAMLTTELMERKCGERDRFKARIVATLLVSALRAVVREWMASGGVTSLPESMKKTCAELWSELRQLSDPSTESNNTD